MWVCEYYNIILEYLLWNIGYSHRATLVYYIRIRIIFAEYIIWCSSIWYGVIVADNSIICYSSNNVWGMHLSFRVV